MTSTDRALLSRAREVAARARANIVPIRVFAEFVIIVTGVLVALAANSWYSRRQDRQLERYYIEQLYADLQSDTAIYSLIGRQLVFKKEALALLDRAFVRGEREIADSSLVRAMIQAEVMSRSLPEVRDATFSELNSTGRLALIRNPALRAEILQYYSRIREERLREEGRRTDYTLVTSALIPYAARRRIDEYGMITALSSGRTSFSLYRPGMEGIAPEAEVAAAQAVAAAREADFWRQINAEQAHALFLESMLVRLDRLASAYRDALSEELMLESPR